jgi:hypothetical protein
MSWEYSPSYWIRLPKDGPAVPLKPGVSFNSLHCACDADPELRYMTVPCEEGLSSEGLNEARRAGDTSSGTLNGPHDSLGRQRSTPTIAGEEREDSPEPAERDERESDPDPTNEQDRSQNEATVGRSQLQEFTQPAHPEPRSVLRQRGA